MTHLEKILLTSIIFVVFSYVISFLFGEDAANTIMNAVLAVDAILISIIVIVNLRFIDVKLSERPQKDLNYIGDESVNELINKLLELVQQPTIIAEYSAKIFKMIPLFVILIFAGAMALSSMIFK